MEKVSSTSKNSNQKISTPPEPQDSSQSDQAEAAVKAFNQFLGSLTPDQRDYVSLMMRVKDDVIEARHDQCGPGKAHASLAAANAMRHKLVSDDIGHMIWYVITNELLLYCSELYRKTALTTPK